MVSTNYECRAVGIAAGSWNSRAESRNHNADLPSIMRAGRLAPSRSQVYYSPDPETVF